MATGNVVILMVTALNRYRMARMNSTLRRTMERKRWRRVITRVEAVMNLRERRRKVRISFTPITNCQQLMTTYMIMYSAMSKAWSFFGISAKATSGNGGWPMGTRSWITARTVRLKKTAKTRKQAATSS